MSDLPKGIRTIKVTKGTDGKYEHVRLVFGPHYFIELTDNDGKIEFALGATHHGFKADASEVNGELEKLIYEIRKAHPDIVID